MRNRKRLHPREVPQQRLRVHANDDSAAGADALVLIGRFDNLPADFDKMQQVPGRILQGIERLP